MSDFPVGLREVIPNQMLPDPCREFVVHTGGSQSTLQDIKLPDRAGGFSFADRSVYTRNRFISWKISHDILELMEISLDWSLISNKVRFRFQDTPILEGLTIHETFDSIIILVATVSSVHKMVFSHPDRLYKKENHEDLGEDDHTLTGIPSIFSEASQTTAREHCHLIPHVGTSPMPQTSASWLTEDEESIFVLANPTGNMNVIKLGNVRGIVSVNCLKSASYLGRILGSFGGIMRGQDASTEAVVSLVIHPIDGDFYAFGLCKDHKIRMWSTTTHECVMVADILQHTAEDSKNLQQGAQNHILRKVVDNKNVALAAFLCFSFHAQFCVFKPVRHAGQFELQHVATIYAPKYDLVDFSVTSYHLWALWTSPEGESVLRYANIQGPFVSDHSRGGWSNVTLEDPLNPDFNVGCEDYDPRQAYLKQLFHPGRFSLPTLIKTIGIYRRCLDNSLNDFESISINRLREEVCAAVEAEIQNQVTEYEISDEEYIALSHNAWSKFYSCAIQYHQAGLKPMGLVSDTRVGLLCVIKKAGYSFIRPIDALEHLVLSEGIITGGPEELFHDTQILCEDIALAQDVINLMRAVGLVSSSITDVMADEFVHSLHRLVSPEQIAQSCATGILTGDDERPNFDFTQELSTRFQQVNDVAKALEVLIKILELDRGIVSHSEGFHKRSSKIFSSPIGISVVAESLHQMALIRFNLTRDIIILQILMLNCGTTIGVSAKSLEHIHSTYLPRSVVMAHCYFVLLWLTETTVTPPMPNSIEQNLRQITVLKISDQYDPSAAQLAHMSATRPITLSELFLIGPGGKARSLLTSDTVSTAPWHHVLMPLVNISAQLLWPKCAVPTLQEFLLSSCQYMQIQEYARLLSMWCDWNSHSRQYLLGSSLLFMGEPEKACDWMIQAAGGITTDRFLYCQMFSNDPDVNPDRLTVLYFLKVIQQFEQAGYSDFVITLAETAMAVCEQHDPDRATLCYILFSYHLKLGHNDEAYDAMVANPDRSRRKDSLRQFIVMLFERGQLKQLASYPFIDMLEDLEAIIESRARSVDLTVNNYYDFLYSFHVMKENYRRAALVMYECGMRLGTEVFSKEGLKRQAQCYLACINCLKLVNADYAWIVKPVLSMKFHSETSPKHTLEGDIIEMSASTECLKPRMEVLEMKDIQREFELVCARLKLMNKDASYAGPGLSASETLSILISSNLYEDAIKICTLFRLDFTPVVEGLASRCVRLTLSEHESAWDWIAANNPSDIRSGSPVDAAWKFLENVLYRLEKKGQSGLHKAVVTRLFSLGSVLPYWIVQSYKKINAAELLKLYLCHGYLEDAATLALEYISAVLGTGKEYFGIDVALNVNTMSWLPYTAFDHLLLELREHSNHNSEYEKLYFELCDKIENYMSTASRVSADIIRVKRN